MKTLLWVFFLTGQVINTGNMNYQQKIGMHEINPIYSEHPSKEKIYTIKAAETVGIYLLSEHIFPEYSLEILGGSCCIVWGFIITDKETGINMKMSF